MGRVKLTFDRKATKTLKQIDGKRILIGFFNSASAYKAMMLEFGGVTKHRGGHTTYQPPRPVFTQTLFDKDTKKVFIKAMEKVENIIDLQKVADEMAFHQFSKILDQDFSVLPLSPVTVEIKEQGASTGTPSPTPEDVGLDLGDMMADLEGRVRRK